VRLQGRKIGEKEVGILGILLWIGMLFSLKELGPWQQDFQPTIFLIPF